jgi:site-specific recombinase XerD
MSSRRRQQQRPITSTDWLLPHRERFLKDIADQGYSGGTLTHYSGATSQFCKEVAKRGLRQGQLVGSELSKVCAAVLKGNQYHTQSYKRSCVKRFVDNLAEGGVAKRPKPARQRPTARDRLRTEYETYLQVQRGLSEATIQNRLNFFDRFMTFRFGAKPGNLNAITPDNLVAFLRKVLFRPRSFRDTSPPTHLRALFRFLFWIGKTKHDLAASLPSVARPRDTHLPRSLKPKEIERLIDAAWSADAPGRRNYAMLLVMARLGLRAPEVIAIKLDDIDWRAGTILIRGKGKRHDHMPLPEDVGKAIVDYIRNGRRGATRILFVASKAPYRPFGSGRIVNAALGTAFKVTGLKPPQKYIGSHLLRHSLATDMLRKGASLDEIGDVLRHRSRKSTAIYAKHDIEGLRSIARDWPVQRGRACPL